jgi:hypothetical protein
LGVHHESVGHDFVILRSQARAMRHLIAILMLVAGAAITVYVLGLILQAMPSHAPLH